MLKLMPTKLDRIQVLFNKDLFNKLRLLATIERRSLSSMVGSIVEDAIKSNKYQSLLSKAKANDLKSDIKESKQQLGEGANSVICCYVSVVCNYLLCRCVYLFLEVSIACE